MPFTRSDRAMDPNLQSSIFGTHKLLYATHYFCFLFGPVLFFVDRDVGKVGGGKEIVDARLIFQTKFEATNSVQ